MDKNWLIRTKNNHILGPVSKNKVIDLIQNGSIKGTDEVSSGNGFWMYVREEELVQRYVFSDLKQPFNPVQEAENVLTTPEEHESLVLEADSVDDNSVLPDESDLEFPSLGAEEDDFTKIGLSIDQLKEQVKQESLDEDLEEVHSEDEAEVINLSSKRSNESGTREIQAPKKKKKVKAETKAQAPVKQSVFSYKILYTIAITLFLLALTALYFRKNIIKGVVETVGIIVPSSHAQALFIPQKKSGLNSIK